MKEVLPWDKAILFELACYVISDKLFIWNDWVRSNHTKGKISSILLSSTNQCTVHNLIRREGKISCRKLYHLDQDQG